MTPFGEKLRSLRAQRKITQKDFARSIGVSAGYLSALEHGHRGKPSWPLVQRIVGELGIIWDEAEDLQRLAQLSDTRVVVDTTQTSANATLLANLLAERIGSLDDKQIARIIDLVKTTNKL